MKAREQVADIDQPLNERLSDQTLLGWKAGIKPPVKGDHYLGAESRSAVGEYALRSLASEQCVTLGVVVVDACPGANPPRPASSRVAGATQNLN